MKKLLYIFLGLIIGASALDVSAQVRVLIPSQGGTGIGSATAGDVGDCLTVSDNSPFTYTLGPCASGSGSGGGLATSTPWTAGDLAQVVDNGTVKSVATSSLGLPTFTDLLSYLTLSAWFATTTDALDEGSANLYYTSDRDIRFSTTSADYWQGVRSFFSTTSASYFVNSSSTIAHAGNASVGNLISWNGSSWTAVATSTLKLQTGDLIETTSLFYTDPRVQTYLDTLSKGYFFATSSADYWKTVNNFFSTTSADYLATQRNFFSTTSASAFINASSTIAHASGVTSGNVLQWDGSAWVSVATSTLGIVGSGTSQWTTTGSDIYYATGFVGIGTTTAPTNPLTVVFSSATNSGISVRNMDATGVSSGIEFLDETGSLKGTFGYNNNTNEAFNWAYTGVPLKFAAGGVERARFLSTGQFGIGTSSPYAKLSVHAGASDSLQDIFVIATSTLTSTTTAFKIDRLGDAFFSKGIYDPGASLGSLGNLLSSTGSAIDWIATSTLKINHTDLGNIGFTSSGHTGTAFRLFGTNASGASAEYATSSLKILFSDMVGVLGISQGGLNAAFTDPNADQLMFWDDSASAITGIGTLSGAAISGTTLTINDVTCTDCLTTTEIADSYFLNNGDVGTGVNDFGGATSLEIVNGTAPTVDTVGEIALDTTDNQLLVATGTIPAVFPVTQKFWAATIASTSVDFVSGGRIPLPPLRDGADIREIHCFVDGGTSVVINVDSLAGGVNTDTVTCGTTLTSDVAMSANAAKTAGSLNALEIGTITGAVDYVTFSVWGTWVRE